MGRDSIRDGRFNQIQKLIARTSNEAEDRAAMKRCAVSLGLIGAFLFGIALSELPQIHERIHPDANQPQHECAVTLIAHGNCDEAAPATVLPSAIAPTVEENPVPQDSVFVAPLFLSGRIFEHAPPVVI